MNICPPLLEKRRGGGSYLHLDTSQTYTCNQVVLHVRLNTRTTLVNPNVLLGFRNTTSHNWKIWNHGCRCQQTQICIYLCVCIDFACNHAMKLFWVWSKHISSCRHFLQTACRGSSSSVHFVKHTDLRAEQLLFSLTQVVSLLIQRSNALSVQRAGVFGRKAGKWNRKLMKGKRTEDVNSK